MRRKIAYLALVLVTLFGLAACGGGGGGSSGAVPATSASKSIPVGMVSTTAMDTNSAQVEPVSVPEPAVILLLGCGLFGLGLLRKCR